MTSVDLSPRQHRCPIRGCAAMLPREKLMCGVHWRQVPRRIQAAVYEAWNYGDPRPYYPEVRQAAIDVVQDNVEP